MTLSLIIFAIIVTAILISGLVIYQGNKDTKVASKNEAGTLAQDTINQLNSSGKSLILNMAEISKHDRSSDCWLLINNKVYDITKYFGSHPGGNSTMAATCGTDATAAYMTKDPYAQNSSSRSAHSSNAKSLLTEYYLGDLNQTIGAQKVSDIKNSTTTINPVVNNTGNTNSNTEISPKPTVVKPQGNITLSMAEISKHNKSSDCWMLISGKVYNITSYFGSHPGGNSTMAATCGTDATAAYMTKDPNATSNGGRSAHSSNAVNLLTNYYIGNLNETIGEQQITQTNAVAPPLNQGDNEWGDD